METKNSAFLFPFLFLSSPSPSILSVFQACFSLGSETKAAEQQWLTLRFFFFSLSLFPHEKLTELTLHIIPGSAQLSSAAAVNRH